SWAATLPPITPPNENPARCTRSQLGTTRSSPVTTIAASPSAVHGSGGVADSPSPGRSGAITVKRRDSGSTLRTQCIHEPYPPCSSTSGGPLPQRRHTRLPSPHGVSSRSASAAIPSTSATVSSLINATVYLFGCLRDADTRFHSGRP